jgi:SAM-dependent methyltransferase
LTETDGWSDIAEEWARSWGTFPHAAHVRIIEVCRIEADTDALDVGCGSGEFLAAIDRRGARAAGVDPSPGMVALARETAPAADVRESSWEQLPWPDGSFDVVTAVNALQFAHDTLAALAEAGRVLRTGGTIAVANWADRASNDLDTIESALAAASGETTPPDGDLRVPGGLEAVLADAGFDLVEAGVVDVPWRATDAEALVRAVLLDAEPHEDDRRVVLEAARPFEQEDGGFLLRNTFRYAVGRVTEGRS